MNENIFEAIRGDHNFQMILLSDLVMTRKNSEKREELLRLAKCELEEQVQAEEKFFYSTLLENQATRKIAKQGLTEHVKLKEMMDDLVTTDSESSQWLIKALELRDKVHQHLANEEDRFFPLAKGTIEKSALNDLGHDYEESRS